ncbi:MAG: DUF3795 domain-containing protein [Thermoleophilia bacterium]|nr:DUF3795 domain-containing protein [Thermoleophilia bacterium]
MARCGYRCDLCLAYRPNTEADPSTQQALSDGWHEYFGFRIPAERIMCEGCLSDDYSQTLDDECPARPCATERGWATCGECPEYERECDKLAKRLVVYQTLGAGVPHSIPEEDRIRFIAPYENKERLDRLKHRQAS